MWLQYWINSILKSLAMLVDQVGEVSINLWFSFITQERYKMV